jgi:hypothetical protein
VSGAGMVKAKKVGIVSSVAPPSHSGQAVVLQELFYNDDKFVFYFLHTSPPESIIGEIPFRESKIESVSIESFSENAKRSLTRRRLSWTWPIGLLLDLMDITFKSKGITKCVRNLRLDMLVVCTGSISDAPAASISARICKIPFVMYAFDDYVFREIGIKRCFAWSLERSILSKASKILVTNEFMAEDYRKRHYSRVGIVRNSSPVREILKCAEQTEKLNACGHKIVFTGAIYSAHFDSFRRLIEAMKMAKDDWKLLLFTSCKTETLAKEGIKGDMVEVFPHMRKSEALKKMLLADLLFLPLSFDSAFPELIRTSSPGKLGDYLASGTPILVHAPKGAFITEFFRRNDCGIIVDNPDVGGLVKALDGLSSNTYDTDSITMRGKTIALMDFDKIVNQGRLRCYLTEVLSD